MSLTEYDEEEAKKVFHDDGYKEGVAAGAAEQKAKDDLIIQRITQEKDIAISEKDAEIKSQSEEIARILEENARMKAQLAAR